MESAHRIVAELIEGDDRWRYPKVSRNQRTVKKRRDGETISYAALGGNGSARWFCFERMKRGKNWSPESFVHDYLRFFRDPFLIRGYAKNGSNRVADAESNPEKSSSEYSEESNSSLLYRISLGDSYAVSQLYEDKLLIRTGLSKVCKTWTQQPTFVGLGRADQLWIRKATHCIGWSQMHWNHRALKRKYFE